MKALKSAINRLLLAIRRSKCSNVIKRLVPRRLREHAWKAVSNADELEIMGSRLYIPPEARNRDLVIDRYEPGVSDCLRRLLQPGMVFCDVGANFGVFVLLGSRLVGPSGRVFAFEPVPSNRDVLERNIARNGARNVVISGDAVSDRNGTIRIFLSHYAGCHSTSSEPLNYAGEFLDVGVVRLDEVEMIEKIDVLKIDVEGAELEVLSGLGDLQVGRVILEFNSERIAKRGLDGTRFIEELRRLGYKHIENIDDASLGLDPLFKGEETTVNLLISKAEGSTPAGNILRA